MYQNFFILVPLYDFLKKKNTNATQNTVDKRSVKKNVEENGENPELVEHFLKNVED
jgi:hypothetical protein